MRLPTLAFCNDIDLATWDSYQEVHKCLREEYGLELEDSFWMFDPLGSEMALFKSSMNEKGPYHDQLLDEIRQGRLTILHAGGNFDQATGVRPSRSLFNDGLQYLREHARVPTIWTNHGDEGNTQNIGWPGSHYQEGDSPSSDSYVLDLLLQNGIRYFWTDRHTTNDFAFAAPGRTGQRLLREEPTRAGFPIRGFMRYRGALPKAPDAETLGKQLSDAHLDCMLRTQSDSVIYQHWCVHRTSSGQPFTARAPIFPEESRQALSRVARLRDQKLLRIVPLHELLREHEAAA